MVHISLIGVPRNLKEAIDWLIALKGTDSESNLKALGAAITPFDNIKRISKKFLQQKELRGQLSVDKLLEHFNQRLRSGPSVFAKLFAAVTEHDARSIVQAKRLGPEDIAKKLSKVVHGTEKFLDDIKNPAHYMSAYSSEATWDASCAKNPEACALIFVGIAPMLYGGLESLRAVSKDATCYVPHPKSAERLEGVLNAVGYEEPECRSGMSGSDVLQALRAVDKGLVGIIYDLAGFWAFY
ncbi:hypothetical protein, conserved [Babesia ovata]|uniref:Uncharacterized protein n=1 Tax=Babesia ovata TaxID=189622 RepID=A0A2H6KID3_9APIC|nr:uncharacterized protein BOVATA_042320 [Babesia ovata]GBE62739.1 hypothetical protein, conserved [Babesia ovata]